MNVMDVTKPRPANILQLDWRNKCV